MKKKDIDKILTQKMKTKKLMTKKRNKSFQKNNLKKK